VVEVEITDNGCGIDEQDMPSLNPFLPGRIWTGLGLTR